MTMRLLACLAAVATFATPTFAEASWRKLRGCDGATLRRRNCDPLAPGPSPVGYRRFTLEGISTAVWYPAAPHSECNAKPFALDIRQYLPVTEQAKINDESAPIKEDTGFYDNLPLDTRYGPYPVIVFAHGTAAWKEQSLELCRHWASRGFVVVSQDHKGLFLADTLLSLPGGICPGGPSGSTNIEADTDVILQGLRDSASIDALKFLDGHVNMERVGMAGHSAGARVVNFSDKTGVRALVSLAGGSSMATANKANVVHLAGTEDSVISYEAQRNAFNQSATPKRFVGIKDAGHLAFSDICEIKNKEGDGILSIAQKAGVCGASFAAFLFDCNLQVPDQATWDVTNYITSATFEEALQCQPIADKLSEKKVRAKFPQVVEYIEDL